MVRIVVLWAGLVMMAAGFMVMYQAVTTPGANPGAEGVAATTAAIGLVLALSARRKRR